MAEKMFYDDQANSSSESLGIMKKETLVLVGNTCICGNCYRRIDHRSRPTACEHKDCRVTWKCLVVELRSDFKDEFDFLPNVSRSAVGGNEMRRPSEFEGIRRFRTFGGRIIKDVELPEGFDKL